MYRSDEAFTLYTCKVYPPLPPTLALFYPKIPLLSFLVLPPPPLITHLLLHRFNPLTLYSCIIVPPNLPPTLTPFYPPPPPPPNYPHYPHSCIELPTITLQNAVRVSRGVGYKFSRLPSNLSFFWGKNSTRAAIWSQLMFGVPRHQDND